MSEILFVLVLRLHHLWAAERKRNNVRFVCRLKCNNDLLAIRCNVQLKCALALVAVTLILLCENSCSVKKVILSNREKIKTAVEKSHLLICSTKTDAGCKVIRHFWLDKGLESKKKKIKMLWSLIIINTYSW